MSHPSQLATRLPGKDFGSVRLAAQFASSFQAETNTVDVVWHTGAEIIRHGYYMDRDGREAYGRYDLRLSMEPSSIRLARLNDRAPFLKNHDDGDLDAVIGQIVPGSARVEAGKGLASILLSSEPTDAAIVNKIKSGLIANVSVGANLHKIERADLEAEQRKVPLFVCTDWEPLEVSAVPIGADPGSHTLSFQTEEPPPMTTTHTPVVDAPVTLDAAAIRAAFANKQKSIRAAGVILAGQDDALIGTLADDTEITLADARERLFARRLELDAAGASGAHRTDLGGRRPGITMGRDESQTRGEAIASVLLARANMGATPTDAENPYARAYRGRSLCEIAERLLVAAGHDTEGLSKFQIAALAMDRLRSDESASNFLRAGGALSTSDFPYLLANVAKKSLRAGYEQVDRTYQIWAARGEDLTDYKPRAEVFLGDAMQLQELPQGAEPKQGDMAESNVNLQLVDYAAMAAVTRVAIVNDDLRGFTLIPQKFGQSAAAKENQLAYALLVAGAWINAANTAATAAAPSIATMTAMRVAAMRMASLPATGDTGLSLGLDLKINVVPPELMTASQQATGELYPTVYSEGNAMFRGIRTVASGALASLVKWYSFPDPAVFAAFRYAYLQGEQGAVIDSLPEWKSGNLMIKCRLAFDVKCVDNKAVIYNAGV